MELGYAEVERLLMGLHGVPPERRGTMRSRIQLLQRGGLPSMPALGRGARAVYGTDETFKLVVAFEMAALGWPAQQTIHLVEAFWPQLRALVDTGLADPDGSAPPSSYAVILPDALSAIRGGEPATRIETPSAETAARWMLRPPGDRPAGFIVIDVVGVARRAAELIEGWKTEMEEGS